MAKLTEEQRAMYLATRGLNCPFCETGNIEGGSVEVNDGGAMQSCNCTDCEEEWTDIYKLSNVVD